MFVASASLVVSRTAKVASALIIMVLARDYSDSVGFHAEVVDV